MRLFLYSEVNSEKIVHRIYYQFDPERVALCPLTIHALLHVAPGIKATGPVWCYWAFPMERYCGKLGPTIRSRRFPFAALARQVLEEARLTQIKVIYDVSQELSLQTPRNSPMQGSLSDPACMLFSAHNFYVFLMQH